MPTQFLSSPREIRSQLKQLIDASERIDIFVASFDDEKLAQLLSRAAKRGVEVNLTTNLSVQTSPPAIEALLKAGANVGTFIPGKFGSREIQRFHANVYLFDNEKDWWTGAIVGSFDATDASMSDDLEAAVLCESNTFDGTDDAGETILDLLDWSESIKCSPVNEAMLKAHRQRYEEHAKITQKTGKRAGQMIEAKPVVGGFASPLSWQQLRQCEWETYWKALLETQERRGDKSQHTLTGAKGWLAGINYGSAAFHAGPQRWSDRATCADLFGTKLPAAWMGRLAGPKFRAFIRDDRSFAAMVHRAVQRCVADPTAGTLRHALSPLLVRDGVTITDLSRLLACAAPDRFVSIVNEPVQHRLGDIVGFDLTAESRDRFDHLIRYSHAIEQIHKYPWAATPSAERSSEHADEPDAWSKRVALLGCFVE